jgi:hypothetical protein
VHLIAEAVCIPLRNSPRAGRRRQAHGLARAGETLARGSVAIAAANVKAGKAPQQVPLRRLLLSQHRPGY